jgi:hypothetical protein
MRHRGKPMGTKREDDEVVSTLSSMPLAYSLDHIPCPCPSGKIPRTPLVPYQFDGKVLSSFGFTFNLLSHVLNIESLVTRTPSRTPQLDMPRTLRATRGTMAPALPVRSLRPLPAFISSGASQGTEYLPFGHSSAVWLRQMKV